jgi:DNA-binding HxlR family transcriptional regulator
MAGYGQFCPVAKAMELLDERWTMLVIRELLMGSKRFGDLQRGVPRMSPALLSKRLHRLIRAGVIERSERGGSVLYTVTPAGRELLPVVEAVGRWGARWVPELGDADLDPHLLLWDMHRNLNVADLPDSGAVLAFCFPGLVGAPTRWWLVAGPGGVDVCDADPGQPVTVTMTAPLPLLVRWWRGDIGWSGALRTGLTVDGPSWARRAVPTWFRLSAFAGVPRPVR